MDTGCTFVTIFYILSVPLIRRCQIRRFIFFGIIVISLCISSVAFAGFEDAGVFNLHTARLAASGNDQSYYVTRVGGDIDYKIESLDRTFKIIPFLLCSISTNLTECEPMSRPTN